MKQNFRERLPDSVTLLAVAVKFGLDPTTLKSRYYRCVFHPDEERRNLRIWNGESRDGTWKCFACGAHRDLVDWVARRKSVSKRKAYEMIRERFGLGPDPTHEASTTPVECGRIWLFNPRPMSDSEMRELHRVRGFEVEALLELGRLEMLCVVESYLKRRVYILKDPLLRVGVARPFSGTFEGGEKARLVRGSRGDIPLGIHLLGQYGYALLTEGVADYIRVFGLARDRLGEVLPLMMVSASARIGDGVLMAFRGKRVRIVAQNDDPGLKAAAQWKNQLSAVDADCDIWIPPKQQVGEGHYTKDIDELYRYCEAMLGNDAFGDVLDFGTRSKIVVKPI